jgi:hypothetical protein
MAEVFQSLQCLQCTTVAEDDHFNILLGSGDGKQLLVVTSINGAAQIATLISASLEQLKKEGQKIKVMRIPEAIVNYAAEPAPDEDGIVMLFVEGNRTKPMLGRLTSTDAKRLGALLTAASQSSATKRIN